MARPKNKADLLEQAENSFQKLQEILEPVSTELKQEPGACGKWSIKDILAHLHEWHNMVFSWYEIGKKGETPAIPSEKYNWKQTPELNNDIYEQYKVHALEDIEKKLESSHKKAISLINKHSNEELFTRGYYEWTGNNALGAYLISCTSSHYDWALKLIKKFIKINL
jgi:hypothetical protein